MWNTYDLLFDLRSRCGRCLKNLCVDCKAVSVIEAMEAQYEANRDSLAALTSREAELVGEVEECDRALQHQVDRVEAAEAIAERRGEAVEKADRLTASITLSEDMETVGISMVALGDYEEARAALNEKPTDGESAGEDGEDG